MTPAVSVLLPVCNAVPYVEAAVRSILTQTFRDFELLLIDDGSTDGSGPILERLAAEDGRIRLLRRENRGLIATLNQGLALARAPYTARMDADDISLPQRLAAQHAHMEAHPEVAALGGAIRLTNADGRPGRRVGYPSRPAIGEALLWGSPLAHPAVMLRTDAVRRAGGYPADFPHAEDYALWLRLCREGALDNLPQVLLLYRVHGRSVSHRNALLQRASTLRAQAFFLAAQQPDPALLGIEDNGDFLDALGLPDGERMRLLARMLALCPHLAGDALTDAEGARWLRLLAPHAREPEIRRALAVYHLRAARFPGMGKGRRLLHAMQALFCDAAACLRHLAGKFRGARRP